MTKMNEFEIEQMVIKQLESQGFTYVYGPDIEPKSLEPLRNYKQVILEPIVLNTLQRLNPQLSEDKCVEALKQITNIQSPDLLSNNQTFHKMLTEGISLEIQKNGNNQGEFAWLIDFENPTNNEFLVINQVTIREGRRERRPDLILYINGLPLVVIELKNATDENATIDGAYHQYYAVNAAVLSTIRASAVNSDSKSAEAAMQVQGRSKQELVQQQAVGDRKAGVVWHTQGSGKSLSMVFYTGKIVLALNNPTVVVIIGSEKRIKAIAQDIVTHFEQRLVANANQGKGMIVSMSRRIAVDLYNEIIKLKPDWHSDDLNDGVIKVVMTASASDGPEIVKHHTTKKERQDLAKRMKDNDDKLKLVIVRDMWLTGFDAPSMHTLYIDKPMKGHNLMQAIARVNRVYKDKVGGLVVDYLGIASDLKEALSFYSDAGGKGDPAIVQDEAATILQEKLEVLDGIMHGYNYKEYFTTNTSRKLGIILESENHILGIDQGEGKTRFLNAVAAMSQAYALATPHGTVLNFV